MNFAAVCSWFKRRKPHHPDVDKQLGELCNIVRSKNDLVEVINERIPLRLVGKRYTGLCPFHEERIPFFSVSPDLQVYHCFDCGAGGDVYRFVMDYEKIDFPSAVRMLADHAGILIDDSTYSKLVKWSKKRGYKRH